MLWVTMTMVKSRFSSSIASSIFSVLIGFERAGRLVDRITIREHAMVRGCTAAAAAAREAGGGGGQPILHLVPHAARVSDHSTRSCIAEWESCSCGSPEGDIFENRQSERGSASGTPSDAAAQLVEVRPGLMMFTPSIITSPWALAGVQVVHPVQHAAAWTCRSRRGRS